MRHKKSGRRLGRNSSHRKAMFRNMAASILKHETIKTTLPKAKELRRVVEPLITLAKEDSVANRRLAFDRLRDMMIGAFHEAGAHPTLAHDLYAMARKAGLLDVCYRPFVVGVRSTDPVVDYLPSTVESMRKSVLRLGLATEATLAADLEACRGHLRRPETVFTLFTVVQVWGRNLTDKDYAVRGFYFGNEPPDFPSTLYTRFGDPRQVGVTIERRFH